MSAEQFYFIIGFLMGVMIMGGISLALILLYHEWIKPKNPNDSLFD